MRLVCPKCDAKYEVPEDAIPVVGRDVQCANCGHSWFQMRPSQTVNVAEMPQPVAAEPASTDLTVVEADALSGAVLPALADEVPAAEPPLADDLVADLSGSGLSDADQPVADLSAADLMATEAATETAEAEPALTEQVAPDVTSTTDELAKPDLQQDGDTVLTEEATVNDTSAPAHEPEMANEDSALDVPATAVEPISEGSVSAEPDEPESEPEADQAPAPIAAAAYAVDESVLAILREEAEREVQARRAEARALESQIELGLDAAMPDRPKSVLSGYDGVMLDGASAAALKSSSRRSLLPNVEEINSTLRPSEVPVEDFIQPNQPLREGKGFRSGFLMMMTLAIIGTGVYTAAPSLSAMVPVLSGPLEVYVGAVDGLRLSLDGIMQSATVAVSGG